MESSLLIVGVVAALCVAATAVAAVLIVVFQ